MLKVFEHCKEEEICSSLKILAKLKEFFESEYVLFVDDVERMCQLAKGEKEDFGGRIIKENLIEYAKKDSSFAV